MENVEILGTIETDKWSGPDGKGGPWKLRITIALMGGRPGVAGVEIYAVDPEAIREDERESGTVPFRTPKTPAPLTTQGIRVPLGEELVRFMGTVERSLVSDVADERTPKARRSRSERQLQMIEQARGPGRPRKYGPDHHEKVAQVYAEALFRGQPPLQAVASHFEVTRTTANNWVVQARRLGFLRPTTRGKATGRPAPPKRRKSK